MTAPTRGTCAVSQLSFAVCDFQKIADLKGDLRRAQQGVVADRYAQAACETRRRPTSKGKRQTMDNLIKLSRATRPGLEDVVVEAFGKDAPLAQNRHAAEAVAPGASARRAALRSASPPNGEDIDCAPGSKPRHMMGTNCSRSSPGL